MDYIETAGQSVLLSYGHFLDILGTKLWEMKRNIPGHMDAVKEPISLKIAKWEYSSIIDLVETDNKLQSKILVVFTTLCKEVSYLQNEALTKYLNQLHYYGEGMCHASEDLSLWMVSEVLPLLLDVLVFIRRCRTVLVNILQQLNCSYSFSWKGSLNPEENPSKFQEVFFALGKLLVLLVALDLSISNNGSLLGDYNLLKRSIKSAIEGEKLIDLQRLKNLSKVVFELHAEIFTGQIFQNTIYMLIEKKVLLGSNCKILATHLNMHLKNEIFEIENKKDINSETLKLFSNIVATYVLCTQNFGITDKKLHRLIIEFSKKFVAAPLFGEILWLPNEFLIKHTEIRRDVGLKVNQFDFSNFDQTGIKLSKNVKYFAFHVFKWTLQMENSIAVDTMSVKMNETDKLQLCIEGLQLSFEMKLFVNYISYLHTTLGRPITKTSALELCKMIELIKGIQSIFTRHKISIAKFLNHTIQKIVVHILNIIIKAKKELMKEKSYNEIHVDSFSSLLLAEKILYGACTEDRLCLTKLALTVTSHIPFFSDGNPQLSNYFYKLQSISTLVETIHEATACHILFSDNHLLSIYLKYLMDSHLEITRVQYILDSWEGSYKMIGHCKEVKENVFNHTKEQLQKKVIQQLCQEVETNLRLQVHSHLQFDSVLPLNNRDYRKALRVQLIAISHNLFSVKEQVETYLDKTFYDLTTVALHDWHTYKKMRSLAEHKFTLHTVEDNLPSQILSQGLDVLEVMRNINVFVSKYLYNLNNQCFIEYTSNNKHLNTININQIANSIWTHGIGIMNTTANFIYQFLRKKLVIFSQFLFDDNIKSRLLKDCNYFLENKIHHGGVYPYERAEKFNKGITRLGVTQGLTYLDQYRILISQIGNALGYVRMVRAGGLHHCLGASAYLPDLDCMTFNTVYKKKCAANAINCFYGTLNNMLHNLTEGTEYFKLLVDVFEAVFCSPENSHLKLFVMIVPPLTINFIQHIISSKEKMNKRNREGAVFTDDGFAMGIAYLLQVLNLYQEFDSLHWFDSIEQKYENDENAILSAGSRSKEDKHENTLKLSLKRLYLFKEEFDLLQYNINSARVFFKKESAALSEEL